MYNVSVVTKANGGTARTLNALRHRSNSNLCLLSRFLKHQGYGFATLSARAFCLSSNRALCRKITLTFFNSFGEASYWLPLFGGCFLIISISLFVFFY
jgi:hypothetical protein